MNVHICWSRLILLIAGFLFLQAAVPLYAQDFSLCSVVDTKKREITLGWNEPEESVTGYSFLYNSHEVTPFQPTVDDPDQLSFKEGVGYGRHSFQVSGYKTSMTTNEVTVSLKKPHFYAILVPGLYQALYQRRYVTTCQNNFRAGSWFFGRSRAPCLVCSYRSSRKTLGGLFGHKNAALNARDLYSTSLREEEFNLWRSERAKAKDVFPQALTVSIVTLSLNAITASLLSPRGKAKIKGGFSLDCRSHPGSVDLCVNF